MEKGDRRAYSMREAGKARLSPFFTGKQPLSEWAFSVNRNNRQERCGDRGGFRDS